MFNNFIIWLPASIVVIYVVYIMGSYFICGNELITINYGDGKTQVIDLSLKKLKGASLISDIKQKLNNVFKDLFPERAEETRTVVTQEDAVSSDGVDYTNK